MAPEEAPLHSAPLLAGGIAAILDALAHLGLAAVLGQGTRIVAANDLFVRMTGYAHEQLTHPDFDLRSLWVPEEADRHQERLDRFTKDHQTPPSSSIMAILRKDGSRLLVETSSAPVLWEGRAFRLGVLREYSTPIESSVLAAMRHHQANHADEVVSVTRPDGVITYVSPNAERLFGVKPELIVGKRFSDIIHPEDVPDSLRVQAQLAGEEGPIRTLRRIRKSENEWALVESDARMYRDAHGQPIAILATTRDVTRRIETEAKLRDAGEEIKRLDRLAAMGLLIQTVAHDARTPLTAILNRAHLTARDAQARGDSAVVESMRQIVESADRINGLVEQLRRHTRPNAPTRMPADLQQIARDAIALTRETRDASRLHDRTRPTGPVLCDAPRIHQVVTNLIANALDATLGSGASVHVSTGRDAHGRAYIEVADDGEGMTPDVRARAFDPLFTTKPQGTGLGLNIVQRIAHDHAATLDIDTAPGKGTSVRVTFPA